MFQIMTDKHRGPDTDQFEEWMKRRPIGLLVAWLMVVAGTMVLTTVWTCTIKTREIRLLLSTAVVVLVPLCAGLASGIVERILPPKKTHESSDR